MKCLKTDQDTAREANLANLKAQFETGVYYTIRDSYFYPRKVGEALVGQPVFVPKGARTVPQRFTEGALLVCHEHGGQCSYAWIHA